MNPLALKFASPSAWCVVLSASMAACSPIPLVNPDVRGPVAVRKVWVDQSVNPQAALQARPLALGHGAIAKATIDRYQKSFESPPPPINVLNIGVGTPSSQGSGR